MSLANGDAARPRHGARARRTASKLAPVQRLKETVEARLGPACDFVGDDGDR